MGFSGFIFVGVHSGCLNIYACLTVNSDSVSGRAKSSGLIFFDPHKHASIAPASRKAEPRASDSNGVGKKLIQWFLIFQVRACLTC
ncbi:hypothetical protein [Pseudomonas viridiflava]|uniref:hypothetical protein n=1 Tax=Pseudomonas viridiflava TaxID=33069 RepID=UPI0013DC2628|nr:hypothetical protein [Pseudomonas viridiflava]